MRSLLEQITRLCEERTISKKIIALRLGVTPVQLAKKLKRPMTMERMRQIAELLAVDGAEFDAYVVAAAQRVLSFDQELLEQTRRRLRNLRLEGHDVEGQSERMYGALPQRPLPVYLTIQEV